MLNTVLKLAGGVPSSKLNVPPNSCIPWQNKLPFIFLVLKKLTNLYLPVEQTTNFLSKKYFNNYRNKYN